jgi:hypothetical protein
MSYLDFTQFFQYVHPINGRISVDHQDPAFSTQEDIEEQGHLGTERQKKSEKHQTIHERAGLSNF